MKSPFFSLNWKDIFKGAILAAITTVLGSVYQMLQSGAFPTVADFKSTGVLALTAFLGYLIKNLFTNSEDALGKKEVKVSEAEN